MAYPIVLPSTVLHNVTGRVHLTKSLIFFNILDYSPYVIISTPSCKYLHTQALNISHIFVQVFLAARNIFVIYL